MNTNTIIGAVVVIIVLVGGYFIFSQPTPSSTETGPIKIGILLPLTGDAAVYGEPARNVMQLAVKEINAAGGVDGREIQLIVEDSKCSGDDAVSAMQKLVNVDKVKVVIGGFCSSESLAAVPVAEAAKVALISSGSSSPDLTAVSKYFSRVYPSDASQGAVLAQVAFTDKGWRTVAFIQEQKDYPLGIYKAFKAEFEKLGGAVTNEEFPENTSDFRSIVTKIKSQKPDAVFVDTQTPAAADRVLKQIAQAGWKPNLLITDTTIGDAATLGQNSAIIEGALGAEFGVDAANPKFSALVTNYKTTYGADMPYHSYAQTEYDTVYLVRDAIGAVGYDGTKVAAWLQSVSGWSGASGSVTIGADGDRVGGHRAEVVRGGKVVPYVK